MRSRAAYSVRRLSWSTESRSGAWTGSTRPSVGWPRGGGEMTADASAVNNAAVTRSGAPAGEFLLYCFAQSGNAYKCALALQLAGADWAPRFVDYFGGETRARAYRDMNVMGEAPVL